MSKKIIATAVGLALFASGAAIASAHGGGGQVTIDPDAPSCMGQLASLHANGKVPGNNPDTTPGFGTNQNHPGLGGPYETIQDEAFGFLEYCGTGAHGEE